MSHHPPISACYAKARNGEYEYWMNSYMKTNFWGASIDMCPLGLIHIKLQNHNEIYSIQRPNSSVHNLIIGTLSLEHSGNMTFKRFKY